MSATDIELAVAGLLLEGYPHEAALAHIKNAIDPEILAFVKQLPEAAHWIDYGVRPPWEDADH